MVWGRAATEAAWISPASACAKVDKFAAVCPATEYSSESCADEAVPALFTPSNWSKTLATDFALVVLEDKVVLYEVGTVTRSTLLLLLTL